MLQTIAELVTERMHVLGLNAEELSTRLGYKNQAKGARRIKALCQGQLKMISRLAPALAMALEVPPEEIERAVSLSWERQRAAAATEIAKADAERRTSFVPHALIITDRSVPSPIFVAIMMGGPERLLRIELDDTLPPITYLSQALRLLPEHVPAFGRTTGVAINYSPDCATVFDLQGRPTAQLTSAVLPGRAKLYMSSNTMPLGSWFVS